MLSESSFVITNMKNRTKIIHMNSLKGGGGGGETKEKLANNI